MEILKIEFYGACDLMAIVMTVIMAPYHPCYITAPLLAPVDKIWLLESLSVVIICEKTNFVLII